MVRQKGRKSLSYAVNICVSAVQQWPSRNLTAKPEFLEWIFLEWLLNVLCLNKRSLTSECFLMLLCCYQYGCQYMQLGGVHMASVKTQPPADFYIYCVLHIRCPHQRGLLQKTQTTSVGKVGSGSTFNAAQCDIIQQIYALTSTKRRLLFIEALRKGYSLTAVCRFTRWLKTTANS